LQFKKYIKLISLVYIISIITIVYPQNSFVLKAKEENSEEEMILEAEDAILSNGLIIENSEPGYSGAGYVGNFSEPDQSLTFEIDASTDSIYELTIGYAAIYGEGKVANILLNDEPLGSITMGDGFGETSGGKMQLNEGINTVTITPNWTYFAIDYIKVSPSSVPPAHEVEKQLVNPNATKETQLLFNYLVDNFGKNILSGQQGDSSDNLADLDEIERITGKLPAILGLDLMDYSPSRVEFGADTDDVERGIEWAEQGGIVTFAWHWNAPKDLLNTEEQPWWSGFYTDASTFDIEYAMNHPESEDYKLILRDIDAIAEELKKLRDEGVPVLWRPLHEAEGGWFWWGAKGPGPVKKLWHLMYDRLTNEHQLNNLIWIWNSIDEDWYPGNDYVDIVSFDSYPGEYNYIPQVSQYEALVDLSNNQKLVAMAENGPIPDPDLLSLYHSKYLYFTTWNGLLTEQNSEEHIKHVYDHDSVITRDELPGFKADVEPDTDENEALEKLQTLIEKAKGYELDQYTEETFTDLSVAIKEAEKLLMYENVTEEQMDDAFVSLQKAIDKLEEVKEPASKPEPSPEPSVDKKDLEELIEKTENIESNNFTEGSYRNFKYALDYAKSILINKEVANKQVNEAFIALQSAVDGLTKVKEPSQPQDPEASDDCKDELPAEIDNNEGHELPKTGINYYNWLLIGFVFLISGFTLLVKN